MSRVFVRGWGCVSPAGWGLGPFREALALGQPLPSQDLPRPGWSQALPVCAVPPCKPRPPFLAHARLRRTSPIAQYAVAAALEALGPDPSSRPPDGFRLGMVLCVMCGCVNYSRRFYGEVLSDPATASPLVFPETVYNAPASHLAALLGTPAINYTLVGDPATFLQGVALGAAWLRQDRVDGCLVIGAEEIDWLIPNALRLFARRIRVSDGAGALYLARQAGPGPAVELDAITQPHLFTRRQSRSQAAQSARRELGVATAGSKVLLCDGLQDIERFDRDEAAAWNDWSGCRLSVKRVLGEGLMAAAAWQCVAACDALHRSELSAACVSLVGCNQQAIAGRFVGGNAAARQDAIGRPESPESPGHSCS